jgi:hypothetical protein
MLEDVDNARVEDCARDLNQGDAISTTHFPSLGVPESTFHPDTEGTELCPDQKTPVWAAPVRPINSRWGVITSQTCDLVEPPNREPWIQVSPLIDLDDEEFWERAQGGHDSRVFALPPVAGLEYPAIEPQVNFPVEKAALLHPDVQTEATPLSPAQRILLSLWLARRCGRHAFPDLTEDYVLRPLRREIGKRYDEGSQAGTFARSLLGVWATAAEAATIKVCFVLNPTLLRAHQAELQANTEEELVAFADQLLRRGARKIKGDSAGVQVQAMVRTLDRIDAQQLLFEMRQVDLDLLPANFFTAGEEAEASVTDP